MKELRAILNAYDAAIAAGKKAALASVVHVDGSSYRRPGARMLVTDDGMLTGAISGGCLEGDALRKAMLVLSQQQSKLVTYDTRDEDDATIGIQLGCAGVIQVLFEPIDASHPHNPMNLLRKAIAERRPSVLVTLFSTSNKRATQPGTCLLVEADGAISGAIPFVDLRERITEDAQTALNDASGTFINYEHEGKPVTAFIEYLEPPVSLVIVGAGNDAIPMMQMADILGWEVRVIDGRNTHARPERFTAACQVLVSKPEQALEQLSIDAHTVFVLMTHNYQYDMAMLKALLPLQPRYIGVLGPKKKLGRMLNEIAAAGITITEEQLQQVYGPTGLEIGAETPEEIALSILSEIKAVLSGKPGGSLRYKKEPIHTTAHRK